MSRAKDALAKVLNVVATEYEVKIEKILEKCSEAEVVDARWICVKLMRNLGFYPSRIGELLRITPRYVQYILTDFDDRLATSAEMRINYEMARKQLRNESERSQSMIS